MGKRDLVWPYVTSIFEFDTTFANVRFWMVCWINLFDEWFWVVCLVNMFDEGLEELSGLIGFFGAKGMIFSAINVSRSLFGEFWAFLGCMFTAIFYTAWGGGYL